VRISENFWHCQHSESILQEQNVCIFLETTRLCAVNPILFLASQIDLHGCPDVRSSYGTMSACAALITEQSASVSCLLLVTEP
jgi:hypothetical protein